MHKPFPAAMSACIAEAEKFRLHDLKPAAMTDASHTPGALSCAGKLRRRGVPDDRLSDSLTPVSATIPLFRSSRPSRRYRASIGKVAASRCEILLTPNLA